MWETIKNDPILRTVAIIILGVLGFGFAYNIMFVPNNMGMEQGGEMGGGYQTGNTFSNIFTLAFKLLLIALIVAVLIAIYKYAKKSLEEGGEIKVLEPIRKDPVLKGITVILLLIIGLSLVYYLFTGLFGFGTNGMAYGYNTMGNAGYGFGVTSILAVLLKLLLVLSIGGLIIGLIMYMKQSYGKGLAERLSTITLSPKSVIKCSECGSDIDGGFKYCPSCGKNIKESCSSCGSELNSDWKCCPVCGKEKSLTSKKSKDEVEKEIIIETQDGISAEVVESMYSEEKETTDNDKQSTSKRR